MAQNGSPWGFHCLTCMIRGISLSWCDEISMYMHFDFDAVHQSWHWAVYMFDIHFYPVREFIAGPILISHKWHQASPTTVSVVCMQRDSLAFSTAAAYGERSMRY
ncbi:unnamed protein product, partial [Sphenostylis stenocarpa]